MYPALTWGQWFEVNFPPLSPNTRVIGMWDYVILALLVFTATITPFEVSFLGR